MYPASSLQLNNSRFYITEGASKKLKDTENRYWKESGILVGKSTA